MVPPHLPATASELGGQRERRGSVWGRKCEKRKIEVFFSIFIYFGYLAKRLFTYLFSITVDIQYYFILVQAYGIVVTWYTIYKVIDLF